jgi:hypothetical protein
MKLKMAMRVAARHSHRDGTLTDEQFKTVMSAIKSPDAKVMTAIENHVSKNTVKGGQTWQNLVQWFKDHWQDILKLILSLLPVLLLDQQQEEI